MTAASDAVTARADRSSLTGSWFTPRRVLDCVDAYFGGRIPFDPYTTEDNPTGADNWATLEDDGNAVDWSQFRGAFCNPPYGVKNGLHACLDKIALEALRRVPIITLLSATRFETQQGQHKILNPNLSSICWVSGRLNFLDEAGVEHKRNTQPSVIYGYNVNRARFWAAFSELGRVMSVD